MKNLVINTLGVSVISMLGATTSFADMPKRTDVTLNPLPNSVLWKTSDFTFKEIGHFKNQNKDVSLIDYAGVGDINGDKQPEIFISGWTYGNGDVDVPAKGALWSVSTNSSNSEIIASDTLFGRNDTDGTTFIRVADFNLDGLNDVFIVGHNEDPFINTESVLYSNSSNGFTAKSVSPRLAMHEGSLGDFNDDGYPDIIGSAYLIDEVDMGLITDNYPDFLPDDFGSVVLMLNDQRGGFTPYALRFNKAVEGKTKEQLEQDNQLKWINSGSASIMGNLDNDPDKEIIIVDFIDKAETIDGITYTSSSLGTTNILIDNVKFEDRHIYGDVTPLPKTYFNSREQFKDNPTKFPGQLTHSIQVDLLDFDNDGDSDIFINTYIWVADGHDLAGVIQILRNDGQLNFVDVTDDVMYNHYIGKQASHEMSIMDVNHDGFMDLVAAENSVIATTPKRWGTVEGGVGWEGELFTAYDKTWSNEVLINTGNGKFVSTFWQGFHDLNMQRESLLKKYGTQYEPYPLYDNRFFPYMLQDGNVGFITWGAGYPDEGFLYDARAKTKFYSGPNGSNPANEGAPGYSEYYYLTENPDVVTAITAGEYKDGLSHYLAKGKSEGRFAFAKNSVVHGSQGNDDIQLREGAEKAYGYEGDDSFFGGNGHDILDGGSGTDTAVYELPLDNLKITFSDNGSTVSDMSGNFTHTLLNIENIKANGTVYSLTSGDLDGDGIPDSEDAFPADSTESVDTDNDGIGNNTDTDDDGDGVADTADAFPLDKAESVDTDSDGIGNNSDTDDDGDGVADTADAFPLDKAESVDTDSDGIGNNTDTDDDGDGVADTADAFPLDKTESVDTDKDGIGNNTDTDDDGDGVADTQDAYPLDATKSQAPKQPEVSTSSGGGSVHWLALGLLALLKLRRKGTRKI